MSVFRIIIQNLFNRTVEIRDRSRSLLEHFQEHGIDWMFACGGKGRCTTCRLIVVTDETLLAPRTPPEEKYLAQRALFPNERLACQTRLSETHSDPESGQVDIVIRVPDDTKLPHVEYSDH